MFIKIYALGLAGLAVVFSSCSVENPVKIPKMPENGRQTANVDTSKPPALAKLASEEEAAGLRKSLDELAELERAGSWLQGMALAESTMREKTGDYAGAVAAAYKELSMAYGKGLIPKEELEKGLLNLHSLKNEGTVTAATEAILAYERGQWTEASSGLNLLFNEQEEPDGIGRWMILVCALEKNSGDRRASQAYKAIRARYVQFPEYWYRGARAFSGLVAAEYAENCINSSPRGPFADECRGKLAVFSGLNTEDGPSIKTKSEIESVISTSINSGNPKLLEPLLPLIGLPDNPYTMYALGALRNLSSSAKYRDFFNEYAVSSKGRLAERLAFICRG
jgi:hypothetical protein